MNTSPYRSFSSFSATIQLLVIRLIQEEFTPLLRLPTTISVADWARAVALADPVFLYYIAAEPAIRICPESYQRLRERLRRELTKPD